MRAGVASPGKGRSPRPRVRTPRSKRKDREDLYRCRNNCSENTRFSTKDIRDRHEQWRCPLNVQVMIVTFSKPSLIMVTP